MVDVDLEIEVVTSWESILPTLLVLLEHGTPVGQAIARADLQRMARLADRYINASKIIVDPPPS